MSSVGEARGEAKAWDAFLSSTPVEDATTHLSEGWTLLHDGRSLGAALTAAAGELVSDLIWGNLALPIDKALEKLRAIESIWESTPDPQRRTEEEEREEAESRRECRQMLELSTNQLEEMMEKKGEFGREYRIVAAAWYMMMLPTTRLDTPLMAPDDASKAAWEFNEKEYERRRAEGTRWRAAREDEVFFDDERARTHPFQFTQQGRRSDITVSVRPPPGAHQPDSRLLTLAVPSPLPSRLPRCQFRQRRVHHTCASA